MSSDSPTGTRQPAVSPPVRSRVRSPGRASPGRASFAASPSRDDADDPIGARASLIGEGPGQYLLFWENRQSFDGLKAQFDEELRAADPIERMWVDEIVDLEWDLHRLRRTRRTIVENGLAERLTQRVARIAAGTATPSGPELPTLAEIKYQALKCVGGDPASHQYIVEWLTHLDMEQEVRSVQADTAELLARLENSIHAASRLRETILNRLYSRRDLIADGRIRSGQGR